MKSDIYILIIFKFCACTIALRNETIDTLIENTFRVLQIQNNETINVQKQQQEQYGDNVAPNRLNMKKQCINGSAEYLDQNWCQEQELFVHCLSDIIAKNILNFGLSLGNQLGDTFYSDQNELFSPLSIISALSLLLLGAKGKSYQQLSALIGIDQNYIELNNNHSQYHKELALMLNNIQKQHQEAEEILHISMELLCKQKPPNWRVNRDFKNSNNSNKNNNKIVNQQLPSAPVINTHLQHPKNHNVKIANGIFIQTGYTLNFNFKRVITALYNTEVAELDYLRNSREARIYINNWVNQKTQGKIPNIITGQIDRSTNILLVSVLYFKAFWENPFFPKATKLENFYPDGIHNDPIKVQMMATGGLFPFYNSKEYDCRIIGLPYKGNEITMYVIQPNNSTRVKIRKLQRILNAQIVNDMIEKMIQRTTVMVLPKMHLTRQLSLKRILKDLGLRDIFINGRSDFSLIGGLKNYIDENMRRYFPAQEDPQKSTITANKYLDRYDEPALIFRNQHKPNNVITAASIANETMVALNSLESERFIYNSNNYHSDLFVGDILHKIDFEIDEQGTEASATTLTYLHRSGTDVVFRGDTPFLLLIQHDYTKLPLFYGIIDTPLYKDE